jgi:hypothetical protein
VIAGTRVQSKLGPETTLVQGKLVQGVVIKARVETNWPFPAFPNPKDTGSRVPKFNPGNYEEAPL